MGKRRAQSLLSAGANVVAVDPAEVRLPSGVVHVRELFRPNHLDGAFLVVVATDRPEVNQAVAAAARDRGVLVNAAAALSQGDLGDCDMMAPVRRGPILVGICGAGPAASRRIRNRIEQLLEPWTAAWALAMETARHRAKVEVEDPEVRRLLLETLAESDEIVADYSRGDHESASRRIDAVLASAGRETPCRT